MIKLLRNTYQTYFDTALQTPERHGLRLAALLLLSFSFAVFASDKISDVYSMMATGVTVLTGFTFTALFSDHAWPSSSLPPSRNENDRQDRRLLEVLSKSFRVRSYYFISISIIETVLLVAASFHFDFPDALHSWVHEPEWVIAISAQHWFLFAKRVIHTLPAIFAMVVIFIYLECLYTFYRMAESVMAILDTKRNYLDANEEGGQ